MQREKSEDCDSVPQRSRRIRTPDLMHFGQVESPIFRPLGLQFLEPEQPEIRPTRALITVTQSPS